MRMKRGLAVAVGLVLAGCGGSYKSVTVQQALAKKKLAGHKEMAVEISAADPQHQTYVDPLWETLKKVSEKEDLPQKLSRGKAPGSGLSITLRIVSVAEGSKGARMFNMGGEAKIEVQADVYEGSTLLTAFTVRGDSRKTTWSLGMFNTAYFKGMDNLTQRALVATADGIVGYLEKNQ